MGVISDPPPKPRRGCGVCRQRKVLCDRSEPSCTRCLKANRACDGYGLPLSWPRKNDRRRAIVAPTATAHQRVRSSYASLLSNFELINVTSKDLEIRDALSSLAPGAQHVVSSRRAIVSPPMLAAPALSAPMRWIPHHMEASEKGLLDYFESVASASLWTIGGDPTSLRGTLMRMALSRKSPGTESVLNALLALSSIRRHGPQAEALKYQGRAITYMRKSAANGLEGMEPCLHVATAMVLSAYEFSVVDQSYTSWANYICGARTLVHILSIDRIYQDDKDFSTLLGWMHYHYVIGFFTIKNWPGHGFQCLRGAEDPRHTSRDEAKACWQPRISYPTGPTHAVLALLLRVMQTVVEPDHPDFYTESYRHKLECLHDKINNVDITEEDAESSIARSGTCVQLAELYQLGALIYLERSMRNVPEFSDKIEGYVQRGLNIVAGACSGNCSSPFLLMVFGAEARTDEERTEVLRLIGNSERYSHVRNISTIKEMIKFSWIQDDLGTKWSSYGAKMKAIFGICSVAPIFM